MAPLQAAPAEKKPMRLLGTVTISAERLAREIHQIVEAIVEQPTTIAGSEAMLKLEVALSRLDRHHYLDAVWECDRSTVPSL